MPELPEVEVTLRGIAPVLKNAAIEGFTIRTPKLRTLISSVFTELKNIKVCSYLRRGKYIVINTEKGAILIHLGMTGHLRVLLACNAPIPQKHDHIDIVLSNGYIIRFNDQRRFGIFEWYPTSCNIMECRWLKDLGPEPLEMEFNGTVLKDAISRRKAPIKEVIMNSHVVVGVGNIYASEALFSSQISPLKPACELSVDECNRLVVAIKNILQASIDSGGTTIRDFQGADGKMGYFVGNLSVYGHAGESCPNCGTIIEQVTLGGRSSYYCPQCQKL